MARPHVFATVLLAAIALFLYCQQEDAPNEPSDSDPGLTITPEGGTLELPNGIILDVPPGAVTASTAIDVQLLTDPLLDTIVEQSGIADKALLAAFQMRPADLTFHEPVSVTVPARDRQPGSLPYLFTIDSVTEACLPSVTDLTTDPDNGVVTVGVWGCSTFVVVEILDMLDTSSAKALASAGCRAGAVGTQEGSRQVMTQDGTNQTCVVSKVDGSITYHNCSGSPTETWTFYEVGEACKPVLKITGAPSEAECQGSPFDITVNLTLATDPIPQTSVSLYREHPSDATISPNTGFTDAQGDFVSSVTPGSKDVIVGASADVTYVISYVAVSTTGGSEANTKTRLTTVRTKERVKVKPRMTLTAGEPVVDVDGSTNVTATLQCGSEDYSGTVEFSVAPAYGTVSSSSVAVSSNSASTRFTGTEEGTATVTATFSPSGDGASVTETVDIEVGCTVDTAFVNYADRVYDQIRSAYLFGSDVTVEVATSVIQDSSCSSNLVVSGASYEENSCSGYKTLTSTTTYQFSMPPMFPKLSCEDLEMIVFEEIGEEDNKLMIEFELYWKADSIIQEFTSNSIQGSGDHTTSESGAYNTHNWVVDMCGVHPNPCQPTKETSSGCQDVQGTHTVTAELGLYRNDAGTGVDLDLYILSDQAVPADQPTQTRVWTDERENVEYEYTSYETDPDGAIIGCTSVPSCVEPLQEFESTCGIAFSATSIPYENRVLFAPGSYPYSNVDGDLSWTVTITAQ